MIWKGSVINYKNISIYYPYNTFLKMPFEAQWYGYILKGFRDLGCHVCFTENNTKKSHYGLNDTITNFDIKFADKTKTVWYDWSDYKDGLHIEYMSAGDVYFKIQFHKYFNRLRNVYPAGQTVTKMEYFTKLPELRQIAQSANKKWDVVAVFRATNTDSRLKFIRALKKTEYKTLAGLTERNGNVSDTTILMEKIDYNEHLLQQAQSHISAAINGVGGDWVWRHTEVLGMGVCLLTLESDYVMPGNPKNCWITVKRDLSDLNEKLNIYLNDKNQRDKITAAGLKYFDEYLSPMAQAKYIIEKVLNAED
jgi:hypothetical protein